MKKSHLIFLPLIVIYLTAIIVLASPVEEGDDQARYLEYADNLLHGFITDRDNPDLAGGPGFPIVLVPFEAFKINRIVPKLLNGLFVFVGIIFFYKTLRFYVKQRYAFFFTYMIGLYPPLFLWMYTLHSESLAFMLISGFLYHVCKCYRLEKINRKQILWASFYLGFLVLTKVIFFHVMMVTFMVLSAMVLFKKNRLVARAMFMIIGGFIFISPYLIYAYSLTGKLFYLGTRGGEILYHRATPYENEWGNWFDPPAVLGTQKIRQDRSHNDLLRLSANHQEFYLQVQSLSNIERDSAFKAQAIANMKKYPVKYLKNTVSNVGRLLFHYPFSYRAQSLAAYGYLLPNMFIIVLLILSIPPAFLARNSIPFEIKAQLIFILIYASIMVLLGGRGRHFIIMVPSIMLFFIFVYTNVLEIKLVTPPRKSVDG